MKTAKFLTLIIALFMALSCTCFAEESREINIIYHGSYISSDAAPYNSSGRIMTPVRAVFEAVGAEVTWDQDNQCATGTKDDVTVQMFLGSDVYTVNGDEMKMDVALEMKSDRVFAPVRYVAESFGKKVSYHGNSRTVVISDSLEYAFYDGTEQPIPTFDSVTGAQLVKAESDGSFVYSSDPSYVTDYFNYLQADLGYIHTNMQFTDNGIEYTYGLVQTTVVVTDDYEHEGVVCIKVLPEVTAKPEQSELPQLPVVPEYPTVPENPVPPSNPNPENQSIDYAEITGAKLTGEYDTKDGGKYYSYTYDPMQLSYYESYLRSAGWHIADYDFNIDTFSYVKYWSNGTDAMMVASPMSFFYGELYIIYP